MHEHRAVELQDLVDTVAETTGAPTTLEDRDLHLVASSGHEGVVDDVRRASVLTRRADAAVQAVFAAHGIARATGPLRVPADPASGRLARWCLPVRRRGVTYAYFWLLDADERVDGAALTELDDVVAEAAAALADRARAADRVRDAVADLLRGDPGDRARAADDLARDGLLPEEVTVVALAPADGTPTGPVNAWVLPRAVLTAPVGHRAALLVPAGLRGRAGDLAERAARALLAQHPAGTTAGVSDPVAPADAHDAWRCADAALRSATAAPGDVTVRRWDDLGADRLLVLADRDGLTALLTDTRASALLAADPVLVATARTYLDLAGSAQRTAAALAVHRQTLYHRLRRVREVSGYDLDDGRDRLALHLVLALGRRWS